MPGAEAAHGAEVARWGGHAAGCCADDGLGDKGDDGGGVEAVEFGVEFRDEPFDVLLRGLVGELVLIRVRGADVRDGRQQERLVGESPREVARERDGAQGGAVPALLPRDEVPARQLPAFEKVLPGELHGRLHGFAAAADEEGLFQSVGVPVQDDGCEVLGWGCRVGARVHVAYASHLLRGCGDDFFVVVADAGDGGAGAGVDDGAAGGEG